MPKSELKSVTNKNYQNVADDLAVLAGRFPTQRTPSPPAESQVAPKAAPAPKATAEAEVQLCFYVRTSLRKELAQLAAATGHDTVRSFVLAALRDKGLSVNDADLVDRRRRSS